MEGDGLWVIARDVLPRIEYGDGGVCDLLCCPEDGGVLRGPHVLPLARELLVCDLEHVLLVGELRILLVLGIRLDGS